VCTKDNSNNATECWNTTLIFIWNIFRFWVYSYFTKSEAESCYVTELMIFTDSLVGAEPLLRIIYTLMRFPAFYAIGISISVFRKVSYSSLSCPKWALPTPSYPIYFRFMYDITRDLPPGLWSPVFLVEVCVVTCAVHPPSFDHLNNVCWRLRIMKVLIIPCSQVSCYFFPLRSKVSCSQAVASLSVNVCLHHVNIETV
jgi:hypothetical protein